jgi:hypothetical protein
MATKTKVERAAPSEAEKALRRHLAHNGKIKSDDDDRGLHDWIRNLSSNPQEDHRSEWEKGVQARLKAELSIVYKNEA